MAFNLTTVEKYEYPLDASIAWRGFWFPANNWPNPDFCSLHPSPP